MRPLGLFGAILGLMALLVAGGIGFAVGAASTVPAGTAVTHVAWAVPFWGFPFFPVFGLLFLFLVIGLIARGARRAAWAGPWAGPGGPGRGGAWTPGATGPDDPRRAVFEQWHRAAHEAPSAQGPTTPDDQASR